MSQILPETKFHKTSYYLPDLPPHIPRVRPADRERVLNYLDQTRAEHEAFEAAEKSTTNEIEMLGPKQAETAQSKIPKWITVLPTVGPANDINASPDSPKTARYHQTIRFTLKFTQLEIKPRVFVIYRYRLLELSGFFRRINNRQDIQHFGLTDIHPSTFEHLFKWINNTPFEDCNGEFLTMIEFADLWELAERFEMPCLQNQIMDYFCTLHNKKQLNSKEFGKFMEFLSSNKLEDTNLDRFLKLVLNRYPDHEFFNEVLKAEIPRRRWMCSNMVLNRSKRSVHEGFFIYPKAHGLHVGGLVQVDEDLIDLHS